MPKAGARAVAARTLAFLEPRYRFQTQNLLSRTYTSQFQFLNYQKLGTSCLGNSGQEETAGICVRRDTEIIDERSHVKPRACD